MKFVESLWKFHFDEGGTTAVEYCVMLSLILLVVIIGITATGGGVKAWWNNIGTELGNNGF